MRSSPLRLMAAVCGLLAAAGCGGAAAPGHVQAGAPLNARTASPQTVIVFAAASLTESFSALGRQFEAAHPAVKVVFNFAGSQQLRAQLEQGAQADLFASANTREMEAAIEAGLVVSGTQKVFARNRLTVIVPVTNPGQIHTLADLARPGLKLVVADKAVPVGQYTLEMLERMRQDRTFGADFSKRVQANVVSREDNVKAVVAKVRLGEADAGIVYSTDATGATLKDLILLPIPDRFNQIAIYPLAVLRRAQQPALGRQFGEFVLSDAGQQVLSGFGFMSPASE